MKRILLCGVFDSIHNNEVIKYSKRNVEFSANTFQLKLIKGFEENNKKISIISAPFIGSYPSRSLIRRFRCFKEEDKLVDEYVSFNNCWGLRNISRRINCFKKLNSIIDYKEETVIYVYSAHTPFLQAAVKAKRRNTNIKICLIVPDLPEYMNLGRNQSLLYKFAKFFDKRNFYKLCKKVDSFVVLTNEMRVPLNIGSRPYLVVEGLLETKCSCTIKTKADKKRILYAGKLDRKFGVTNLLEAFEKINDKDVELIICGAGEDAKIIEEYARKNPKIIYYGQMAPEEAKKLMISSDILVNPRQNCSEYTKYSFPSKTIDYLSTGNIVVAYKLDGMPEDYEDFVTFVPGDSVNELAATLNRALNFTEEEKEKSRIRAYKYLNTKLLSKNVVASISSMNGDE